MAKARPWTTVKQKNGHLFARARAASLPWPSALVGACTRAVVKHVAALEEEEVEEEEVEESLADSGVEEGEEEEVEKEVERPWMSHSR